MLTTMSEVLPDALPTALPASPNPSPHVILDTQIVMDWLVFDEPSIAPLIAEVVSRRLLWVATEAMRAELLHVLGRGVAAQRRPDLARIDAAFQASCQFVPAPELALARPRCTDPDDQKFIDLALDCATRHPTWLISRDRAVLAVAKRVRKLGTGLEILTPAAWLKGFAPPQ